MALGKFWNFEKKKIWNFETFEKSTFWNFTDLTTYKNSEMSEKN